MAGSEYILAVALRQATFSSHIMLADFYSNSLEDTFRRFKSAENWRWNEVLLEMLSCLRFV